MNAVESTLAQVLLDRFSYKVSRRFRRRCLANVVVVLVVSNADLPRAELGYSLKYGVHGIRLDPLWSLNIRLIFDCHVIDRLSVCLTQESL